MPYQAAAACCACDLVILVCKRDKWPGLWPGFAENTCNTPDALLLIAKLRTNPSQYHVSEPGGVGGELTAAAERRKLVNKGLSKTRCTQIDLTAGTTNTDPRKGTTRRQPRKEAFGL